ncbi:putative transcriptional regulator [Haloplanus vescus]|uniref:Putative transcriptional regulator n=1 Tax=Haloplanus vescus TaxID=555874 RepID=A0A1H3XAI6_9EURY|nr:MarR family transcriptional regulator [Haloplanus vescus]SDZ95951.1 putative transcriptional regulator [Haloplanus vescus]
MAEHVDEETSVLQSKRSATRYQILVAIAERQPAVSQREIADEIGITAQAVSDYLQDLVEEGYVRNPGRGRYEVTKEGVDWLIGQTDELREFVTHVSEDVIGEVEIETAIATAAVESGESVSLSMRDGILRATPGTDGSTTAVAVTDAAADEDVGVTDFEGVLDYELGRVTAVSIPRVQDGGSDAVACETITDHAVDCDLVATAGTEAFVAARRADLDPDMRFGTPDAVNEAAVRGLDVLLLAVADELSTHLDRLREGTVSYRVVDTAE